MDLGTKFNFDLDDPEEPGRPPKKYGRPRKAMNDPRRGLDDPRRIKIEICALRTTNNHNRSNICDIILMYVTRLRRSEGDDKVDMHCLEEEDKSNLSLADKEESEILAALAVEQATKEEVAALDKWNEAKSDAESVSEFGKPWYFKNTHEQTSDTDLWDDEEELNDLLNDYYDLMECWMVVNGRRK